MADSNVVLPNNVNVVPAKPVLKTSVSQQEGVAKNSEISSALNVEGKKDSESKPPTSSIEAEAFLKTSDFDEMVKDLNAELEKLQNYLKFEKDDSTERMVIFVKDRQTDEVIRQIPSEEFLAISKNITKFLEMRQQQFDQTATPTGLITNEKA